MNSYGSRPLGLTPGPRKTSSHMGAGVCRRGHGDVNKNLYGSMRPLWIEDDSEEFYRFDEFNEEFEEEDDFYELVEYIDNQRW